MKRYAAIDVGTNSTRLLVGEVQSDRILTHLFRLQTTRIGEGIGTSRFLLSEAIERTLKVLLEYQDELKRMGVKNYQIVATSAVREATNGQDLVNRAQALGLKVEVISGQREAWYSYIGATHGFPGVNAPVVVDIGGGSIEFIWSELDKLQIHSIPVGAVRLTESPQVLQAVTESWSEVLEQVRLQPQASLIGVGGTITTVAAIEQGLNVYQPELIHGFVLNLAMVKQIERQLSSLSLEERRRVPGLQPERADIILAGIYLLRKIMELTGQKEIRVSESDLLQGIIWTWARFDGEGNI